MRGAYRAHLHMRLALNGEPPRARGLRHRGSGRRRVSRRTPACAGPTVQLIRQAAQLSENPRVRGAYYRSDMIAGRWQGEPPRARGLRIPPCRRWSYRGRTPACAGPTSARSPRPRPPRENPRVRGAYAHIDVIGKPKGGEPPRARGLPSWLRSGPAGRGRTPACAGPTQSRRQRTAAVQENPRVRGAYRIIKLASTGILGEPPRARGLPTGRGQSHDDVRRTPACAGPTPARC